MIDAIVPAQAVAQSAIPLEQPATTPLPAEARDVVQFEQIMDKVKLMAPESTSVVKIIPPPGPATEAAQLGDKLQQGLMKIDENYRAVLSRLMGESHFDSYLEKHGVAISQKASEIVGPQHVSNIQTVATVPDAVNTSGSEKGAESPIEKFEQLNNEAKAYYSAGVEYTRDSTRWFMTTEFWLTKLKILTSAVTQTSTGLKTLFRAGGA